MSIWGKRVDRLFTPQQPVSKQQWNRRGVNFLWQAALVGLVALIALLLFAG